MNAGFGTDLVNAPTMLGPSAIALRVQMGRDERLVGPGGVPLPDAIEAVDRMVFVGGWKAQVLDDHAQGAWVEQTQDLLQAQRAMVVRRKMDNEHTLSSAPIRSSAVSCSKPRFLTRMEEISLFHQRGCRKNRNMALLSDMLALG